MSERRKSRRTSIGKESRSSVSGASVDEQLAEAVELASLKAIPLEERRKDAEKPLFLTRYE